MTDLLSQFSGKIISPEIFNNILCAQYQPEFIHSFAIEIACMNNHSLMSKRLDQTVMSHIRNIKMTM